MTHKILIVVSVGVFLFLPGAIQADPNMNPGKWEINTRTEMAGMPAQSMTHTQCITGKDLVPMDENANRECTVSDVQTSGDTVSWKIECGGQGGGMAGTGTITYNGDSMSGNMTMTISGTDMTVKNTISGKRIGDCDDESSGESSAQEHADNEAADAIRDDAEDVGAAAKDEIKKNTIEGVRKSIRGLF